MRRLLFLALLLPLLRLDAQSGRHVILITIAAVHATGRVIAAVDWSVTVGSPAIDYNFPDYGGSSDTTDNIALARAGVPVPTASCLAGF